MLTRKINKNKRAREMTAWLRTLPPAEDLGWSPAHMSLTTVQPVLGSGALFRPPLASHAAGTHTDTWTKLLVKISTCFE